MPVPNNPDLQAALDALRTKVEAATGAMASAVTYIQGQAAIMQAAVDAAEANGASLDELAPVQAAVDAMDAKAQELAAAIAANPTA